MCSAALPFERTASLRLPWPKCSCQGCTLLMSQQSRQTFVCQQLSRQTFVCKGRHLCVNSCHGRPLCAWQTFVSTAVKADLHANSCQGKSVCLKADVCVSTAVIADHCVHGRPLCQQPSRQTSMPTAVKANLCV